MVNARNTCVTKDRCANTYHISLSDLLVFGPALTDDRIYAANNKIKLLECNECPLSMRFILLANNIPDPVTFCIYPSCELMNERKSYFAMGCHDLNNNESFVYAEAKDKTVTMQPERKERKRS